jgi:hypothetical protein
MARDRKDDHLRPETLKDLAAPAAHAARKPARSRASYDLHPDTIARIKKLAADLDVPIRIVAQRLLDYALEAHERGELELRRTPIVTTKWGLA